MGVSTNAIMAFGFDLGEELPESFQPYIEALDEEEGSEGELEIDDLLACAYGVELPEFGSDEDYGVYEMKRLAALAHCHVDIITHCSGEYPMYFLALRGTNFTAYRGTPALVVQRDILQTDIDAMRAFCEKHAIAWQEPGWHIFSMWN